MKLADFGLSIDATEERPVTRAGTLDYMAPEVRPVLKKGERKLNVRLPCLGACCNVLQRRAASCARPSWTTWRLR